MSTPEEFARRERLIDKCKVLVNDDKYEISSCGEHVNHEKQTIEWQVQRKGITENFSIEEFEVYIKNLEKEIDP
ncbi:hypothetical protein [Nostoc sphaeroides]|uniref:hypothetical protein n=1 Tax=Nostoc TaxID=1177 RepID=UPI000E50C1F0|nr:hypothetical protein [Nostoc sphaeroides]MCC5628009.1 hypothetical protein [Nostoc sphaeroides CHAB 2801]